MRPNFFVNTPDILPTFLQTGGPSAFTIRAVLAATLSPTWGVYSGFEVFEHQPVRPGSEEYLDSEKYEYRPRDFAAADPAAIRVAAARPAQPDPPRAPGAAAAARHHLPPRPDADVIVYSKRADADVVLVVCSLDPHHILETEIGSTSPPWGSPNEVFEVRDELTGQRWRWGQRNFVRLTPTDPAHVLTIVRPRATTPGRPQHQLERDRPLGQRRR